MGGDVRACWGAQEGDPEGVTFKLGLGDLGEGQGEEGLLPAQGTVWAQV